MNKHSYEAALDLGATPRKALMRVVIPQIFSGMVSGFSLAITLSLDDYKETMKGIYSTSIDDSTLDEAPMAYKSLDDIIDVIRDSVDVIDIMKPIYNFKASE